MFPVAPLQFPNVFRRPRLSPGRWHEVRVCRRGVRGGLKLDEIFDHKCVPTKQANPRTRWKLIFNRLAIVECRELEVIGRKLWPDVSRGIDADVPNWSRHAEREK